jgi:hypothetical protein
LLCSYEIHWTGMLQIVFLVSFGKLSTRRGAWAWFHGVWTCGAKVLEYWMISSLKIKLNRSWKLRRNWNFPLVLLEGSWWAGFNGIYLVRFEFRMWGILMFKWFLLLKIQTNSKKPGFGRKNQLRNTWAKGTGHISMNYFKNLIPVPGWYELFQKIIQHQ